MKVIRGDIWLCSDCVQVAVNGDSSFLDYSYTNEDAAIIRWNEIEDGIERLGPHLVPHFDSETGEGCEEEIGASVTRRPCDCCRDPHHGSRHRFAILGES